MGDLGNTNGVASPAAIEHLRWTMIEGVGPIRFAAIVERFGSAQEALGGGVHQLQGIEGIGQVTAEAIARSKDCVDVATEIELAARHNVRIICRDDDEYPVGLRHIPDAPICLYVRGRLEPADAVSVAIVGARRCTLYGREHAYQFGFQLARAGLTVVSGLARGIDGEAHRAALDAGGRTIAVLGNGLSTIYPQEHEALAQRVAENGAVISELPMSTGPESKNFLPRNRIISGMSLGTVVVEAAKRSGALASARLACEYDREVFALPGRVDSVSSAGTNALIRDQHAKLVTCANDVIDELGEVGDALQQGEEERQTTREPIQVAMSDEEQLIFDALDTEQRSIEAIASHAQQPTGKVASTLITLQLKGLARQMPGNLFVRRTTRK